MTILVVDIDGTSDSMLVRALVRVLSWCRSAQVREFEDDSVESGTIICALHDIDEWHHERVENFRRLMNGELTVGLTTSSAAESFQIAAELFIAEGAVQDQAVLDDFALDLRRLR